MSKSDVPDPDELQREGVSICCCDTVIRASPTDRRSLLISSLVTASHLHPANSHTPSPCPSCYLWSQPIPSFHLLHSCISTSIVLRHLFSGFSPPKDNIFGINTLFQRPDFLSTVGTLGMMAIIHKGRTQRVEWHTVYTLPSTTNNPGHHGPH